MRTELDLTIHIPAEDWHYCQRRLTYLETLLLHVVRVQDNIQEWYLASDLAALRLPGLPTDQAAVTRRAKVAGWKFRRFGRFRLYHVTSLPPRAFDALIARILDLPEMDAPPAAVPAIPTRPAEPPKPALESQAPEWVLPLMRLMRSTAMGDLGRAWRDLPAHLPRGAVLPTPDDAATVLLELGLFEKVVNWKEH